MERVLDICNMHTKQTKLSVLWTSFLVWHICLMLVVSQGICLKDQVCNFILTSPRTLQYTTFESAVLGGNIQYKAYTQGATRVSQDVMNYVSRAQTEC